MPVKDFFFKIRNRVRKSQIRTLKQMSNDFPWKLTKLPWFNEKDEWSFLWHFSAKALAHFLQTSSQNANAITLWPSRKSTSNLKMHWAPQVTTLILNWSVFGLTGPLLLLGRHYLVLCLQNHIPKAIFHLHLTVLLRNVLGSLCHSFTISTEISGFFLQLIWM